MATQVTASARLLALHITHAQPWCKQGATKPVPRVSMAIVSLCTETAVAVTSTAIQVHGRHGV